MFHPTRAASEGLSEHHVAQKADCERPVGDSWYTHATCRVRRWHSNFEW